jgi:hypothetical protein
MCCAWCPEQPEPVCMLLTPIEIPVGDRDSQIPFAADGPASDPAGSDSHVTQTHAKVP